MANFCAIVNVNYLSLRNDKGIMYNVLRSIIILNWIFTCGVHSVTKILLRVEAGAGISFIDLWNLNGTSTGTDTGSVYRNGILDNGFRQDCPSKIYFFLGSYNVRYEGVYTDNSLAWLTTTPAFIQHTAPLNDVTLMKTPNDDVIFKIHQTSASNLLFLAVYHPTNAAPYPEYYHVDSNVPLPGPIPDNKLPFTPAAYLEIKGRFEDSASCNLVDPNTPTPTSDVVAQLQSGSQTTAPPTTESVTTTMADTTSTAETTTSTSDTVTTTSTVHAPIGTTTTSEPMCPCDCDFKQRLDTLSAVSDIPIEELRVQLAPVIKEIKENLTVDVSKLSSTIRKKQSAADGRQSAEQMGVLGAVLLGLTFGMLILIDISSIPRHIMLARRNCCDGE